MQFVEKTESEILSKFIGYDEKYREKLIAEILPALLNKNNADINSFISSRNNHITLN